MSQSHNDASRAAAAAERCGSPDTVMPPHIAARLLQVYQVRNALLGADLFHAPAWEILLLLETAEQSLGESDLLELMNVPFAALQRWIDVLLARGLIARTADAASRETFALTGKARETLAEALRSALRKPAAETS